MSIYTQREEMLAEIAQEARLTARYTGRESFSPPVMAALSRVPRHEFVPSNGQQHAYCNTPLPIGYQQTISQPYIVALMTDLLELEKDHIVLEIGTGSGYQTAILAELAREVYSIEINKTLAEVARIRLHDLGYTNVHIRQADGYYGWPDMAPFDRVIVTSAIDRVPPPLVDQTVGDGRIVIPLGRRIGGQELTVIEKDDEDRITTQKILPVSFVPFRREVPEDDASTA